MVEISFTTNEGKGSIIIENGNIGVLIDNNTDIYKIINEELEKGFTELREFKDKGIPGKMKYNRKYKCKEDIIILLRRFNDKVYNIVSITKPENMEYNIVEIYELKSEKLVPEKSCIREFDDRYEYYIIEEYENKYVDYRIDIIQFEEVFIKIVSIDKEKLIVSINFIKEKFDINGVIDWIRFNEIKNFSDEEKHLKDVRKTIEGIRFKDNTIILYTKGIRDLLIDRAQLMEIDDKFFLDKDKKNIFHSKLMSPNKSSDEIILDGEKINYIPEIRLYSKSDLIVSNGHIIEAKYIGNYENSIGFFKDYSCKLPVAWVLGALGPIQIDHYIDGETTIVFIEYTNGNGIDDFN